MSDADAADSAYGELPAHHPLSRERLDDETDIRLLLRDHESAGDDARYRDRMIHTGFYLSLVFAGILLDTGISLAVDGRFGLVALVSGFGSASYYVLYVWTESFLGARNAAWNRRRQIEYEVGRYAPGVLTAHEDVFNRLAYREADGQFVHEGRAGTGKRSSSGLTVLFIRAVMTVAALISVVSIGLLVVS